MGLEWKGHREEVSLSRVFSGVIEQKQNKMKQITKNTSYENELSLSIIYTLLRIIYFAIFDKNLVFCFLKNG